jgi:hypothetical protein
MVAIPACHWVCIDDTEFITDTPLSADELAQCIFQVTGGSMDMPGSKGETDRYQISYDPNHPATLQVIGKCEPGGVNTQNPLWTLRADPIHCFSQAQASPQGISLSMIA